jgi:uncharacterized membrane protein YjfL (UPF0719 family)
MWELVWGAVGIVVLLGVFWLAARLMKRAQAADRRYGGDRESGAGWPGPGPDFPG